ncbi:hypothetical protein [Dyadobacter psychrotolerans]|uniref:Carboxypeptidase regulatory-like domain-containing protein n=1 Tax=Dyadobacter psychrotolerans TaxID=2541721 RepID=A0A4V2Z447_9BACT|nr:hypothetical protein [Dyadobacter psychrotolerans]TDE15248.1 hypothetical protein E0F88_12040 [Dyadobacter psychrotolerans]
MILKKIATCFKRLSKVAITLTLASCFPSCDCYQNVSGIVIDKRTKQVVDSAYVQNVNRNYNNSFTNEKGHFELKSISGGFRNCPPMTVSITKAHYEIKTLEIENRGNDTIYLQRIN